MADPASKNKERGEAFLAENRKRDDVTETDSGLQYRVLQDGSGPSPAASDTVSCHYRGTLVDGTEFDSSYSRGEPAQFPLNRVIPGWTEVLQLMPAGAKWQVVLPSDLAYGPQGAGGVIGPHETLVFDIELLDIV